jgi:hypothetical protein
MPLSFVLSSLQFQSSTHPHLRCTAAVLVAAGRSGRVALPVKALKAGQEAYWLDQIARNREEYFSGRGESPGRFVGCAAAATGLDGEASAERVRAMFQGLDPATGEQRCAPLWRADPRSKLAAGPLLAALQTLAAAQQVEELRTEGVESEMELAFAALHQLCAPLLGYVDALPGPQRDALQTAFGLGSVSRADPFLVGLAVLTLFSNVAESQPLVCLVDDAQWLDHASAQALAFVARRLEAESVFMLFAERDSEQPSGLTGLAELWLERLLYSDARELLATANLGALDERARDASSPRRAGIHWR